MGNILRKTNIDSPHRILKRQGIKSNIFAVYPSQYFFHMCAADCNRQVAE
jgi:hypothetical protein